jgi:ribonuclease E
MKMDFLKRFVPMMITGVLLLSMAACQQAEQPAPVEEAPVEAAPVEAAPVDTMAAPADSMAAPADSAAAM